MEGIRTQTLLFTDVVRSTSLFADNAVADVTHQLRRHLASQLRCVEHRRGRPIKTLGDGVMASFDSATDALACAVSMQQSVSGIAIRVGISSGDVRMDGDDCHGLPVVEASRLCDVAQGGQILLSETTRLLMGASSALVDVGMLHLKGLPDTTHAWQAVWSSDNAATIRAVLADDSVLMREGIARALENAGIEIIGQTGNADTLIELVETLRPDVAITDVRMPPAYREEGIDAAATIRALFPSTAVIVLTQHHTTAHATRLRDAGDGGVGYVLKESIGDLDEFADMVRHVAAGGYAFTGEPDALA